MVLGTPDSTYSIELKRFVRLLVYSMIESQKFCVSLCYHSSLELKNSQRPAPWHLKCSLHMTEFNNTLLSLSNLVFSRHGRYGKILYIHNSILHLNTYFNFEFLLKHS
jgi:hypothetical protein